MLASTAPTATTLSTSTSPASSSRSGRLRGLNYLRTYTHNHLLPHSNAAQSETRSNRPPLSRSSSSPADSSQANRNLSQIQSADATSPDPHGSAPDPAQNNQASTAGSSDSSSRQVPTAATSVALTQGAPAKLRRSSAALTSSGESGGAVFESMPSAASPPMTRNRASTTPRAAASPAVLPPSEPAASVDATAPASQSTQIPQADDSTSLALPSTADNAQAQLPSIRFIPYQDPRSARPSLQFAAVSRTLPNTSTVIRVGRYSEKDQMPEVAPNTPSAAPVGFKSKVVSRRHCEFSYQNSQWFVKDVKSSSGTFLNHIRLSPAGHESRPWPVNDGDVLQLGIDFRGGEEMIFRCVKIRIELNRGWQKGLNTFNKSAHKRIRNLNKSLQMKDGDAASTHTSECAICLLSVSPCQSLFVAPCSHVWHYKCIRPILNGRTYPQFTCPNCRMLCDLEADVDELSDFDVDEEEDEELQEPNFPTQEFSEPSDSTNPSGSENHADNNLTALMRNVTLSETSTSGTRHTGDVTIVDEDLPQWGEFQSQRPQHLQSNTVSGSQIASSEGTRSIRDGDVEGDSGVLLRTPRSSANYGLNPDLLGSEGPMTPRNDAGPFILDGSAGRSSMRSIASLDIAATEGTRGS